MAVSQSITLTQGTQSIANNTTQVTFKWTSTQTGESWNGYTRTAYYYVSINGGAEVKYSVSYTLPKGSTITIASKTFTVTHNNDGTGSISIRTWMDTDISAGIVEKSKSLTLTTIPRATVINSLSCSTSYFNGTLTYKYTPQSASYYNRCNISLNLDGEFIGIKSILLGKKSASQQTGTVTLSSSELNEIYNLLPATTKGILRFTFRTYSDADYSKQVGSGGYKEVTLTIPTSVVPTIGEIELNPVNITTKDGTSRNILVQGKNKLQILVHECKAGSGSTIKSYTFSGPNVSETTKSSTNASYTFNSSSTISKTGTLTYTVKLTDQRGRSVTETANITCYAYSAPTISSFSACRCNSNGTVDDNGTYIKYSLKANYASVNVTNNITVKIYYKISTSNSWTTGANALTSSTTKSAAALVKSSSDSAITFDLSSTYNIYASITDNYGGSNKSSTETIFSSERILNIRPKGKGIAFGKMAESDNLLESKWPVKIDDELYAKGNIVTSDNFGCDDAYNSSNFATYCQWADEQNHDILVRLTDGLSMGLGWTGGDNYQTSLDIRPKKVNIRGATHFQCTTDAATDAQNDVPVRIGNANGNHIDIDGNEIIQKESPTTLGTLNFNANSIAMHVNNVNTLGVSSDSTSEFIKSVPTYNRTYDTSSNVYISSNGIFGRTTSSSQRYKTDIKDVQDNALDPYNVLNIPIRQYRYNDNNIPIGKNANDIYIGLIAEEVANVYPIAAEYNEDGEVEMWNIKVIVPAMLKILQDQQNEIKSLKKIIEKMQSTTQN